MPLHAESDMHRRRSGRNIGLAVVLVLFVALVFGLSVAKIVQGDLMEAFDHQPRVSVLPVDPNAPPKTSAPVIAPGVPAAAPAAAAPAAPVAPAEGANQ